MTRISGLVARCNRLFEATATSSTRTSNCHRTRPKHVGKGSSSLRQREGSLLEGSQKVSHGWCPSTVANTIIGHVRPVIGPMAGLTAGIERRAPSHRATICRILEAGRCQMPTIHATRSLCSIPSSRKRAIKSSPPPSLSSKLLRPRLLPNAG